MYLHPPNRTDGITRQRATSGQQLLQFRDAFLQSRQFVRSRQQQAQIVDEALALPVLIGLGKALHGGIEESLRVALIKLDLGEVEKTPGLVERRKLLGLSFTDARGADERQLVRVRQRQVSVHLHAQLQRIEQRIGMAAGNLQRLLIRIERVGEALGAL